MAETSKTTAPEGVRLVVTRDFDARPEDVFDAWLNPDAARRWLFATPTGQIIRAEIDPRVGGRFCIVRRDGDDVEHVGEYLEIDRPRRLVFTFGVPRFSPVHSRVTVEIVASGVGCRLTLTQEGTPPEWAEATRHGWTMLLRGLGEILAQGSRGAGSDEADFVISRVFDAPRALVFKTWTDPKHMARWWGPHGCTNPVCELDPRIGGAWRIVGRGPDGSEHPTSGFFHVVVEPERIVMSINHSEMSDNFHDQVKPGRDRSKGKPALEALITVIFDEQGGKTTVTIRQRFESAAVRDAIVRMGLSEGWSQSLERLRAVVTGS
jgi:uncharacterized protein YndB with AHSA1/START domain